MRQVLFAYRKERRALDHLKPTSFLRNGDGRIMEKKENDWEDEEGGRMRGKSGNHDDDDDDDDAHDGGACDHISSRQLSPSQFVVQMPITRPAGPRECPLG